MNRTILLLTTAVILMAGDLPAKPLPAELVMGSDRVWRGKIISRDGDWIEFISGTSTQPIRIGVGTIQSLNFEVAVDANRINQLMEQRAFEEVIAIVREMLKPFEEYRDIPSNLTRYEAALMELYYYAKQYEESLAISKKIVTDDRDPALQSKARIYHALALIASGDAAAAQTLVAKYGWNEESTQDTPPEELYIKAKLKMLNGEYRQALLEAAKVVVFHSQDPTWMNPSELLCAELYTALGMYESAEEVCRQILLMYRNTPEYDEAEKLLAKVEKLQSEQ